MPTVREVDPAIWQRARAEGVRRGLTMGQVVTAALEDWLRRGGTEPVGDPRKSRGPKPPSKPSRAALARAYEKMKG